MATGYGLLEMLIAYYNGDVDNIIEDGGELLEQLYNDPKSLGMEFERELESFALSENRCYLCNSDLEVNSHLEDREYQGQIVKETVSTKECSNYSCSYVVGE